MLGRSTKNMTLVRPNQSPEIFEGISNCVVCQRDVQDLLPPGIAISRINHPQIELVFESTRKKDQTLTVEIPDDTIHQAIAKACDQYSENISPQIVEDRFEDYLLDDLELSVDEASRLYKELGLYPFIVLERIFISEPLSTSSFDFSCYGESYLEEHGFSFDLIDDEVEFVTPRGLMIEGSYPASRNKLKKM